MLSYADETVAIVNAEANRVSTDGSVVPFPQRELFKTWPSTILTVFSLNILMRLFGRVCTGLPR